MLWAYSEAEKATQFRASLTAKPEPVTTLGLE
jgi:hypothetical protein